MMEWKRNEGEGRVRTHNEPAPLGSSSVVAARCGRPAAAATRDVLFFVLFACIQQVGCADVRFCDFGSRV